MAAGTDSTPLRFSCGCGRITGQLTPKAVQTGTHLVCFCKDCRAAEIYLGRPDPAPDPVDILQTSPEGVSFETGKDLLGLFRFSPNGLMRWYSTCCGTPMFNTLPRSGVPFVGVLAEIVEDPERLGKVRGRSFLPQANGTTKHEGSGAMIWGLATRILASRLSGSWKDTPFYDIESGKPVVTPKVLSKEERAAATP